MASNLDSMPERPQLVLDPKPSQEVSCPCCNHSFLVILQPSPKLSPLAEDPNQPGLEGFPVQRFPVTGVKPPREHPVPCVCGAFALRRRKSEPWPHEAAEIRLWKCASCKANVLTRETFWKTTKKSYVEAAERHGND